MIKHHKKVSAVVVLASIIAVIALAPPMIQWLIISVVLVVSWMYTVNTTITISEKVKDRNDAQERENSK